MDHDTRNARPSCGCATGATTRCATFTVATVLASCRHPRKQRTSDALEPALSTTPARSQWSRPSPRRSDRLGNERPLAQRRSTFGSSGTAPEAVAVRQGPTSAVPGDVFSARSGHHQMTHHENVTRPPHRLTEAFLQRPSPSRHALVVRDSCGFMWELRESGHTYGHSPVHYPTAAKAQDAGDRALARGFRSTI